MASVAGRQIDTRFQNTSLLNQAASQSTSLYQKCSSLRDKLLRIRGFTEHFPDLASSSDSTDPVMQLWDLFSMGTPLCYIFDQLPAEEGFNKLNQRAYNSEHNLNLDRAKKRAIALFAMQLRAETVLKKIPDCEMFTVTDVWDRYSTDGLVKVVNTVTAIVNYLPQDVFEEKQASTNPTTDTSIEDAPHRNIIREMLETERKYVQDLETMQKFSNALSQSNIIDQDTIHLLFPNLNKLVNFQRKFLIRLEFTAQLPLKFQRWGEQFIEYEEEFSVYEPYCVNYKNAVELMLSNEPSLTALNHLINVKSELPALLLKPIQRVCQYPLLLESLVKVLSIKAYDHHYELVRGSEAAKRVIDKINEAQRRAENQEIVGKLKDRVEDWKGHKLENFGDLLLHDVFIVTKSDIDRVYISFLFEKIMVLCKEDRQYRKGSKKKFSSNEILAVSSVSGSTPLLMKGRIFANNIVSAKHVPGPARAGASTSKVYPLMITWKGDDELESFTMQCTRQEQMKQWEETVNRVIETRKSTIKSTASPSRTEVPLRTRFQQFNAWAQPSQSRYSTMSHSTLPLYSLHSEDGDVDEDVQGDTQNPVDQEPVSDGDDDLEDYPPPSYPPSGRETPIEARALTRSRSLPTKFKPKKDGSGEASSSTDGQITSRARSNSLPASVPPPSLSDTSNEPSDSEPTPPQTPLASKAEDMFRDPFQSPAPTGETSEAVKLKVYYREDIFILLVPRSIKQEDLMQKIERKVRLCGPVNGPLKVKYRDEDEDLVSLTSTEDVQLAFDQWGPGKAPSISFFVT